jgi:hypothetical protein
MTFRSTADLATGGKPFGDVIEVVFGLDSADTYPSPVLSADS